MNNTVSRGLIAVGLLILSPGRSAVAVEPSLAGDLNEDGCVDQMDFELLQSGWPSTHGLATVQEFLASYGGCPTRIEFASESRGVGEAAEGSTVELRVVSSKPLEGNIRYAVRWGAFSTPGTEVIREAPLTTTTLNGVTSGMLPVELPSTIGHEIGSSVVVALLGDDQVEPTYSLGIRSFVSVPTKDSAALLDGLWAARLTLTRRMNGSTAHALPVGVDIPLFFSYDSHSNQVALAELPELLPDVSYVRQAGDGRYGASSYSPVGILARRPGLNVTGQLINNSTFRIVLTYDVAPAGWDRPGASDDPPSRELVAEFPLPPSDQERLTSTISASSVSERSTLFTSNGRPVEIALVGTGVLRFHSPQSYSTESKRAEGAPNARSKRFLAAMEKFAQRRAASSALPVAPPSHGVILQWADSVNLGGFVGGGAAFLAGGYPDGPNLQSAFGQPVAGVVRYEGASEQLRNRASVTLDSFTQFMERQSPTKAILKGNTPVVRVPNQAAERYQADTTTGTIVVYDGPALDLLERDLVTAISINPFDRDTLALLLEVRARRGIFYNLLSDRLALDAWNIKYENPQQAGITILEQEQDEFQKVADHALTASKFVLTLFDDRQRLGVGEVMRLEHPLSAELEGNRNGALKIATESMRRWSVATRRIVRLELLKNFSDEASRRAALDMNLEAQTTLEEALRWLGAYSVPQPIEGAPADSPLRIFSNPSIGFLEGELSQLRLQEQDIRQGLNAFGFVPDFVPFLITTNQQNETDNVQKARQLANSLLSLTRTYELQAQQNLNRFVDSSAQYESQISALRSSYDERLRALCGVIELQRTDGTAIPPTLQAVAPDLLTYAMPPGSEEGNPAAVDRDELLVDSQVTAAGYRYVRRSYGQIWNQYLNIGNAEDRISQAQEDLANNYRQMQLIEDTANQVAGIRERNVARIKKDGAEIVLLTKELGRLQKEAILAQARAEAKAKKKGGLFGAISGIVSGFASGFTGGGLESILIGGYNPAGLAASLVNAGLSLASSRAEAKAASAVANIQANFAVAEANIQAQIQEIEYLQRADILFDESRVELLRSEEQLKILALQQARLSLTIRIAERDLLREQSVLDGMLAEVDSLLAEAARHEQMAARTSGIVEGYAYPDYRASFTAAQSDAEAAFERAQAATFIAVRALDYYLNESQSIGQIYENLHTARRADHLEAVLTSIDQALALNPVIIASDCPYESALSLKYHLVSTADVLTVGRQPGTTELVAADAFSYWDVASQQLLRGEPAYQARLRDFLRASLNRVGSGNLLRLEFSFATDVFQRRQQELNTSDTPPADYDFVQNPLFNSGNTRSQTFIGYTPQQCQTQTGQTFHGLTMNFVGTGIPTTSRLVVTLGQQGNQYLRSGRQDLTFDPLDQLAGMNVYSTYRQNFPRTLRLSGTGEPAYEQFPGSRTADFSPRVNGVNPSGGTGRTLVFTDRAIACDRWVLVMDEATQGQGTPQFLRLLDAALAASLDPSNPVPFTLLDDIQFTFGWVPKFAQ